MHFGRFFVLCPILLLTFSGCGEVSTFAELAAGQSDSSSQTFTCTPSSNDKQVAMATPAGSNQNVEAPAQINALQFGCGMGFALLGLFFLLYGIWRRAHHPKHIRTLFYTLSVFFAITTVYVFKKQIVYLLSLPPTDAFSYYLIDFLWFLLLGLSINRAVDSFLWRGLLQANDKPLVPKIYMLVTHTVLYVVVGLLFLHFGLGRSIPALLFTSSAVFAVLIYLSRPVTDSAIAGFMIENAVMGKGDHVQIGDYTGTIQDIDSQRVILYSDDKNLVYLPNTVVQGISIVNHSRPAPVSFLEVTVTLEYETTPSRAFQLIEAAIAELDEKIEPHRIYIKDLAQFGIVYGVVYTHQFDPYRQSQTRLLSAIYYKVHKDRDVDFGYDKYDSTNNSPINNPLSSMNQTTHQSFVRLLENAENQKLDALLKVDFFAALSGNDLKELAKHCTPKAFGPPENIIRQGEPGNSMFVVVSGRARVLLQRQDQAPIEIAVDGPGSFFGEMALLTGKPRGATVRAMEDVCLLEIPKAGLQALFERDPKLVIAISEIVSARKEETSAIARDALKQDQASEKTVADALRAAILKFFGLKA